MLQSLGALIRLRPPPQQTHTLGSPATPRWVRRRTSEARVHQRAGPVRTTPSPAEAWRHIA